MYYNQNTVYRTQEYRIYPTTIQKSQLAARFDLEDSAYNTLAGHVNQSYCNGAGLEELKVLVQNHPIPAENEVDRFAISQIRKRIISLLPRLCSGRMACIKPRRADRSQRSAYYRYVGISDYHLVLPMIGSIAMEQHRDLPKGARIYGATVYADCLLCFLPCRAAPDCSEESGCYGSGTLWQSCRSGLRAGRPVRRFIRSQRGLSGIPASGTGQTQPLSPCSQPFQDRQAGVGGSSGSVRPRWNAMWSISARTGSTSRRMHSHSSTMPSV